MSRGGLGNMPLTLFVIVAGIILYLYIRRANLGIDLHPAEAPSVFIRPMLPQPAPQVFIGPVLPGQNTFSYSSSGGGGLLTPDLPAGTSGGGGVLP